ncbi:MAG: PP2C family protein-serine/threonine phosphatase, partial [Gammaproteobacteria bacterium]|nr:PP2C family protein-serine/threonine phosphatase [Gammaproteobacteria bacterium]
ANAAAMAIYNARLVEELLEQERIKRDLELARIIQTALLPDNIENQMIFGINIPARELSGDFYDYFQIADGRIIFNLGDVAGKGANAALLMAKTTSLFRCLGKNITSPAELLSIINNEIYANITHGLFVTMIAGIYDPEEKRITLANAGHQPPIHVSEKQNITILETSSPPLGVVANTRFEEYNISLNNGSFYAFTDGLTEFEQQPGQPSGEDGVKQAIIHFSSTPAADRLKKIISQITNRNLDSPGHLMDDITMLLIDGNNLN